MQRTTAQSGFTLIEMLVSLTLFTVVVTITVGSILVLIGSNRQLTTSQSVLDSLAFSLDSMTREIRTGQYYYCGGVNQKHQAVAGNGTRIFKDDSALPPPNSETDHDNLGIANLDCPDGRDGRAYHGVSVIESGDSITGSADRILYYYQADYVNLGGNTIGTIMRRVGNEVAQPIISSSIDVTDADFFVTGSERLGGGSDTQQPTVTILLTAEDINDPSTSVTIQTTVTQRELDI